jgi:enoyl-CoA hydratase
MILLMERAAREALRPFLEVGEESVGVDVQVQHVGGVSLGAVVQGLARVTNIEDRRIAFDVTAMAGDRILGKGSHQRALIRLDRLIDSLAKQTEEDRRAMNPLAQPQALPPLKTLLLEIDSRVATITLNRPKVLNAVNAEMTTELEAVVAWLMRNPEAVRVVLIRGAGAAFCAGDDVKELPSFSETDARQLSFRQAEMYLAMERLPQPVIALIHGDAMGGGCVAAYSADFRIATHDARLGMPEIKLGWPPGYGIAQLTALVGKARALEMCLMGDPITAERAMQWGLVHEVVASSMLMQRGLQWAHRLLQLPAEALRETKRLVHMDEGSQPKVAYRADTDAYVRCLQLDDAREGIQAFVDKRPPKFRGS